MPTLTGSELSRRILAEHPQQPIIICSGFSESMDSKKAGEIGIFRFLMKPISTRELADAIYDALKQKKSGNKAKSES
jgi:FixJ family two-component response regulator